jgi:hypothetical protein
VDAISFVDTLADASLDALQIIYTAGEIETASPPAAYINTLYKSRLFLARTEDHDVIWFSKTLTPGVAAELVNDDAFKLTIGSVGGNFTALEVMDEVLYIFRETAVYTYQGEGPDASGAVQDYNVTGVPNPTPTPISLVIGCASPGVVANTPEGLVFPSQQGIYMIPKGGGAVQYIGERVQSYESSTFTSVDNIPNKAWIRFATSDGYVLQYDYQYDLWSVFTSTKTPAVDATTWDGNHILASSDGYVRQQLDGYYQDDSSNYDLVMTTSWYSPSGLGGYCQLDKVFIEGDYIDAHSLTILVETRTSSGTGPSRTYTISSGNMTTIGYPVMVEPRMRCESFRITLTATGSGACATWSGLRVEVAPLQGTLRLGSNRRESS